MNAAETIVHLLSPGGTMTETILSYSRQGQCCVMLAIPQVEGQSFDGTDLFVALQALRRELEKDGIRMCCNGARRDAWPSRMARDMGGAGKVYIHRMGEPATRDDLVDIFGDTAPENVSTVAEQESFHRDWAMSIRER